MRISSGGFNNYVKIVIECVIRPGHLCVLPISSMTGSTESGHRLQIGRNISSISRHQERPMLLRLIRSTVIVAVICCFGLASVQADEPVLLKYKVAKGDTLHYKSTQSMKQAQSLMVNGMRIKQDNNLSQEVFQTRVAEEVGSDGKVTFRLKADRRKATAEFGAYGKVEFDSRSTERDTSSAIGSALTPLLERLTGSDYEVFVDPRGKVTEVKGYAELIADIVKANPLAGQFGGSDNSSAVMNEQEGFVVLSEKPVSVGDEWEVPFEMDVSKLGKIKAKTIYKYEGPDQVGNRQTARIALSGELSLELNIDLGVSKVSGTLTASNLKGTAQFDPAAGRVVSIKRDATLSGMLTVDVGGMTIPVDNQQEQSATYELLERLPE
jgi:hypothetical protein